MAALRRSAAAFLALALSCSSKKAANILIFTFQSSRPNAACPTHPSLRYSFIIIVMEKKSLHDTQRYNDPLGDHLRQATDAWQRRLERYPKVDTVYSARYIRFSPTDKNGALFLGGSEGIVGSELFIKPTEDVPEKQTNGSLMGIFGYSGRRIAHLEDAVIGELISVGWKSRCFLAHTVYNANQKTFETCCACFCYSSDLDAESTAALETFIGHIVERIALKSYPRLDLTQEQLAKVIDSRGEWFLTKEQPWPELPKGSMYYRRRRTFNDRLIAMAISGNKGCLVASWVGFMLVIVVSVLLLVWLMWFR